MKHNRNVAVLVALLCTVAVWAVPAKRCKTLVRQPDGSMVTVMVRGDENFHFMSTEDGMPIVMNADKAYCYAYMADDGVLRASAQVAHDAERRSLKEKAFLAGHKTEVERIAGFASKLAAQRNKARLQRVAKRQNVMAVAEPALTRMAGATGGYGIGVTGKRKGLVILVNFQDVKMQSAHDNAEWNDFFNKTGYNTLGNSGSVHDYFYSQSYGLFDLSFDVVGPVTVSKNMADYGGNDDRGNDKDPGGMVYEACRLVADKVNFADYDWDGDGEVDQVFVIYAGYGEASRPALLPNTIWPHEWTLKAAGYSLTLNKVKINTYGCTAELNDYGSKNMAGTQNTLIQSSNHILVVLQLCANQTTKCTTIFLVHNDIMGNVNQTTSQISCIGSLQCGIRQTLTSTVSRNKVLQHRQTFLKVRKDRVLDNLSTFCTTLLRLSHQTTHT